MNNTEIIYNILARHHELTIGAIFKKCAGTKSIANQKTVSNALTRLKNEGRVQNVCDQAKGLWLWSIVRNGSPEASSGCDSEIKDPLKEHAEPDTKAWPIPHDEEMASDVAEVEAVHEESSVTVQENLSDAHAKTDDAPQIDIIDAVLLSGKAKTQAGWAPETVADTSNVLGLSVQARHETSAAKPATMPVGIAIAEFCSYSWKEGTTLAEVFMCGIAFAEEYHKIGPNENGDYL